MGLDLLFVIGGFLLMLMVVDVAQFAVRRSVFESPATPDEHVPPDPDALLYDALREQGDWYTIHSLNLTPTDSAVPEPERTGGEG